jgi:hypothetical protein
MLDKLAKDLIQVVVLIVAIVVVFALTRGPL